MLLLRWSWRDLRARWLQVVAIALIIAIGSGTYSGLTSVSEWRYTSYDASFAEQHMYDLRVDLADGALVAADRLAATVQDASDEIDTVEVRLVQPTQVDASTDGETILVPGRMVGVEVGDGGPHIGTVEALQGRALRPADADAGDVVVLDEHFADRHDLPAEGTIEVSGDRTLTYVGRGVSPEHYFPLNDRGSIFADFALLYAPIETVQALSGEPDQANEAVLTVTGGADLDRVQEELDAALGDAFPRLGTTITQQQDDRVLRLLYDDIESDQRLYDIFALLILAGAAFAAFNLTVRVVEAQRREIGIGMALGVPPGRIAVRPLLMAGQVALLGAIFGVGVGLLIDQLMAGILEDFFPLPAWSFDFQAGVFLRGAALGFVLPVAATVGPVWRAVRVAPVDAIRTGHRAVRGRAMRRVRFRLPGSTVVKLPFRNVLREPRRSILTALGIGASIATLVGVIGMIDSFLTTIDLGEQEIVGDAPDRLTVGVDFAPIDSDAVEQVTGSPLVADAEAGLTLGGMLAPDSDDEIEVLLTVTDLESDLWQPTAEEGTLHVDEPGLVIADKAARDLGVGVGDEVTLRHPKREGLTGYSFVDTELPVLAIHPNPYRFVTYVDTTHASLFELEGITNTLWAEPATGSTVEEVQRGLFDQPGVVSIEPVTASADAIRDQLSEVLGVFDVIQAAVLLMAALIAFNSTAINMDERVREHATMFAFGLPTRAAMAVAVVESLLIGLVGTLIGVVGGRLILEWLTRVLIPQSLPEIGVSPDLSTATILTAVVLGTVVVGVAPLFTLRRLRRMDIPAKLRVME